MRTKEREVCVSICVCVCVCVCVVDGGWGGVDVQCEKC